MNPVSGRPYRSLKECVFFPAVAIGLFVILFGGLIVLFDAEARQQADPHNIVMTKCTECHSTKRICDNLDKKDREEWTETIYKMVSNGADVAEQDIPAIAEYLADLEPGSKPVCR